MSFDFDSHRNKAEIDYGRVKPIYEAFAFEIERVLKVTLTPTINIHEFQARAKTMQSFLKKACKPSKTNPLKPRYPNPLMDLTDLAGVRVIAFFPKNLDEIETSIRKAGFVIKERRNIGEERFEAGEFGYQSIHLLVELPENRKQLEENKNFRDLVCEIQVRTILQHAWAEMEHDIQYKSSEEIPPTLRRRFLALAGMIEIADREFQAIQDEDAKLKQSVKSSLEDELTGNFGETEKITKSDAVSSNKKYTTDKLSPAEINSRSARLLVAQGKYEAAVSLYNDKISVNPTDFLLYAGRSKARFLSGDTRGAIEDINKAISGVPDDDRLKRLKEQYEEGYVTKVPTIDFWTLVNEGNDLLRNGNAEEAFGNYSKAQELGFSYGLATFNKAMARILAHDCDGASFFVEQLTIFPDSPMQYSILGLKAVIAAACNNSQVKKYKELEERFNQNSFNFDFSQSPLRHLEKGFVSRDGNVKNTIQKVFDLLKASKS